MTRTETTPTLQEITASQLRWNDVFYFNTRKNAKQYHVALLDTISGDPWSNIIAKHPDWENDVFVMGTCGTKHQGQLQLKPYQPVYVPIERGDWTLALQCGACERYFSVNGAGRFDEFVSTINRRISLKFFHCPLCRAAYHLPVQVPQPKLAEA